MNGADHAFCRTAQFWWNVNGAVREEVLETCAAATGVPSSDFPALAWATQAGPIAQNVDPTPPRIDGFRGGCLAVDAGATASPRACPARAVDDSLDQVSGSVFRVCGNGQPCGRSLASIHSARADALRDGGHRPGDAVRRNRPKRRARRGECQWYGCCGSPGPPQSSGAGVAVRAAAPAFCGNPRHRARDSAFQRALPTRCSSLRYSALFGRCW